MVVDEETRQALVGVFEKAGQWNLADEFKPSALPSLPRNTLGYNELITQCESGGRWEQAVALFEGMKAAGVPPDTRTFNALIQACGKGGRWEIAMDAFKDMKAIGTAALYVAASFALCVLNFFMA